MTSVDVNQRFRYIVVEGRMVELPENMVDQERDLWEQYADSQVSSGWMAAAYRVMKDDPVEFEVISPDEEETSASTSTSLTIDPQPAASGSQAQQTSTERGRSRSRTRKEPISQ